MTLKDFIDKFKHTKITTKTPNMSFPEAFNFLKDRENPNTVAIVTDNLGEKYICLIEYNQYCRDNFALGLYLYNNSLKMCSSMLYYRVRDKLFLSSVQTNFEYRNRGLAHKLNALSNYVLQEEVGTRIIGNYAPFTSTIDNSEPEKISEKEKDFAARSFYNANGFEFINIEDFKREPQKHPYISETDFTYGDNPTGIIITRIVDKIKDHQFKEENGIIVECEHMENSEPNA